MYLWEMHKLVSGSVKLQRTYVGWEIFHLDITFKMDLYVDEIAWGISNYAVYEIKVSELWGIPLLFGERRIVYIKFEFLFPNGYQT